MPKFQKNDVTELQDSRQSVQVLEILKQLRKGIKVDYSPLQEAIFFRLTENSCVVAKWEVGRGGKDWKFGISRCKLVYIGWINNKVLLYSTGNYI